MARTGPDFLKQRRDAEIAHQAATAPGPLLPLCSECDLEANPEWRDGGKVYCRLCAPPSLKNPEAYHLETTDGP